MNSGSRSQPLAEIIDQWQQLPAPAAHDEALTRSRMEDRVRSLCDAVYDQVNRWQNRLGQNALDDEDTVVLAADSFTVHPNRAFEMNMRFTEGQKRVRIFLLAEAVHPREASVPRIIWRRPSIRFRTPDRRRQEPVPLSGLVRGGLVRGGLVRGGLVRGEVVPGISFGVHPGGGDVAAEDLVAGRAVIDLALPPGTTLARVYAEAELDPRQRDQAIVRCTISTTEQPQPGTSVAGIIGEPSSELFAAWKRDVLEFARLLPQVSHGEPAPSDRDPIPFPFDPVYNNPERNWFHYRIKYHRDDAFLVDNVLDPATRLELDQAWNDLLSSFAYHETYLGFTAEKYGLELDGRGIGELDDGWFDKLPADVRSCLRRLQEEYFTVEQAALAAQPGHLADLIDFAGRAWRRPLECAEQDRLRAYYERLRQSGQTHREAVRACLARVLTAPSFLYRAEVRHRAAGGIVHLSDWELASRLSYFLWSSIPDAELRRAAADGRLQDPQELAAQARRMLRDPQARRLAAEFFGQWLGFYRFDRYQGVDRERYPEFTETLKAAMHDEATTFFEHLVREDRPVGEILFSDRVFVGEELAAHYGIDVGEQAIRRDRLLQVDQAGRFQRGGLFGLGAVLTATSAPRRTSAVKRGDWILRRVLGTPVPPPPADAGSIPADDVLADGLTVRQRLAAHRRDASCRNCHARIDPLGFALEHFDAIGRRRSQYRDGQAIDATGSLHDGTRIDGLEGLKAYLRENVHLFERTLCRKLIGYALGRPESIADVALAERMVERLQHDGRFSGLVAEIVTSPQFRLQRPPDKESERRVELN